MLFRSLGGMAAGFVGVVHPISAGLSMVLHMRHGLRNGGGEQHSYSPQSLFWNCPGLEIVMPSTPHDGKGLMRSALMSSVRAALDRPWVLDIDATIKPLYGRQEGAEVGYNPHKPGRPSHVLHTFWVGNLRLVLDALLTSGKQHTSGHAKAALGRLLDELGDKAPALLRGDCGYGNEEIIDLCEAHGVPVTQLGAVMGDRIVVKDLLDIDLAEATTTWRERLPRALGAGTVQA